MQAETLQEITRDKRSILTEEDITHPATGFTYNMKAFEEGIYHFSLGKSVNYSPYRNLGDPESVHKDVSWEAGWFFARKSQREQA